MNQTLSLPLPGTQIDPRYPDSDGRFMGETDYHNIAMSLLRDAFEDHFADVADVYIASNLVFYWQEGDPKKRRDPDVLVAKGVGKHRRRSYRLWEEKKLPCTLFEIASKRTWRVDLNEKSQLYASIGIKEYFAFDPEYKYLDPPLQGFRRRGGKPTPMRAAKDGALVSKELGVRLLPQGEMLRVIDLATGRPILTRVERADREKQRAQEEKQRARQEKRRARQEKRRAEELSNEVARLRRILKKQSPEKP